MQTITNGLQFLITDYTFFLQQSSTLQHYTLYQPSDLCVCVKELHRLFCNSPNSNLPAIKEKYSQHKVKRRTLSPSSFLGSTSKFFYSIQPVWVVFLIVFVCVSVQICGQEVLPSFNTFRIFPELRGDDSPISSWIGLDWHSISLQRKALLVSALVDDKKFRKYQCLRINLYW